MKKETRLKVYLMYDGLCAYQVGDLVNAFESLVVLEGLIKNFKKKFSPKEW